MSPALPDPAQRHFSMVRGYRLSDVITLGNAICGTASILAVQAWSQSHDAAVLVAAFMFLPVALVMDALDGMVARKRGGGSEMGRELDSLADVVSFGIAPAAIAHALGLSAPLDLVALMFFVACGVSRLARFNVTAAALTDARGKVRYFEGTPITVSLLLVAMLAGFAALGRIGEALPLGLVHAGPLALHPLSLAFVVAGCAMASRTLRIPKP